MPSRCSQQPAGTSRLPGWGARHERGQAPATSPPIPPPAPRWAGSRAGLRSVDRSVIAGFCRVPCAARASGDRSPFRRDGRRGAGRRFAGAVCALRPRARARAARDKRGAHARGEGWAGAGFEHRHRQREEHHEGGERHHRERECARVGDGPRGPERTPARFVQVAGVRVDVSRLTSSSSESGHRARACCAGANVVPKRR